MELSPMQRKKLEDRRARLIEGYGFEPIQLFDILLDVSEVPTTLDIPVTQVTEKSLDNLMRYIWRVTDEPVLKRVQELEDRLTRVQGFVNELVIENNQVVKERDHLEHVLSNVQYVRDSHFKKLKTAQEQIQCIWNKYGVS